MITINIKKIIDVQSILPVPAQGRRNFANAIVIQKGNGFADTVRSYSSPDEVLEDLGSNSEAYKCSLKYFAGGFLGIKPTTLFVGLVNRDGLTSSTQGFFTSGSVTGNLANFQAVDDGEIKISKDGSTPINLTNIDFTDTDNFESVAAVLQNAIRLAGSIFRNVAVSFNGTQFIFTSETYGAGSEFEITTLTGTGTDLTDADLLNGGVVTVGTNGTLASVISNFTADNRYYHTILSNDWNDQEKLEWSGSIEASTRIKYLLWILDTNSNAANAGITNDFSSISKTLFDRKVTRTAVIFDFTDSDRKQASLPSYFGIVDFTSARPLGSLAYKQFTNISTTELNDSQFDNLMSKNINFYTTYGETGRVIAYPGKIPNGLDIKTVITGDYIDYNMTYDIFDLMVTLPSIGYTRDDFALLRQAMTIAPMQALSAGMIAGGTDRDTGEVLRSGFKITIPQPETISLADKNAGVIKNITTVLLLKGVAIRFVITNTLKL